MEEKIRNASTKIYKTYTIIYSRLKLKILERKDRQILIAVHSSGGSRPSDKDEDGDSSRPWHKGVGAVLKNIFRLFGSQFGPNVRWGGEGGGPLGPSPGSATAQEPIIGTTVR